MTFFLIIETIILLIYYFEYENYKSIFNKNIHQSFYINSLDYQNNIFKIQKITPNDKTHLNLKINTLYIYTNEVFSVFESKNDKNFIKISLKRDNYDSLLNQSSYDLSIRYLIISLLNLTLALILAKFIITPIKEGISITDEFIKDILHDINTPLSVIKMNVNMLEELYGDDKRIDRIKKSVEKISLLQTNLKCYQQDIHKIEENILLNDFIEKRILYFKEMYPLIEFDTDMKKNINIKTSKEMFERIFDNLISNSCKYNKTNGKIHITLNNESITIEDTGVGIKNVDKVFNRLYKENDRGIGIGLNIVKKMINELNMNIKIESVLDKGTIVRIYFK